MIFNELFKFMQDRGVSSLAGIARELKVSPQSVSNWKARGQVPYKYVIYIQNKYNIDNIDMYTQGIGHSSSNNMYTQDVDVSESLFTNPVQHVVGQASIAPNNATATLTYAW